MGASNGLPSPKEAEILELLISGRPMYGLEMVKASNGSLKRGTIYVLLERLEQQGAISSEKQIADINGIARRRYKISGLGQRSLYAYRAASSVLNHLAPIGV